MENQSLQTQNTLPPAAATKSVNATTLIGLGIGGALAYGLFVLINNLNQGQEKYNKDIDKSEDELERIPVKVWELTKATAFYRTTADNIHTHLDDENWYGVFNKLKWNEIYNSVVGLNPSELQQVAKEFGYRTARSIIGRTAESANIFGWFEGVLDSDQQKQMRAVWQKSGLWGNQFSTAQKNSILKSKWQAFTTSELAAKKIPVFPGATSMRRMIFINGVANLLPSITTTGYWQLGNVIMYNRGQDGRIYWLKVLVTNRMYPEFLGKQIWIMADDLNKTTPDQNDPLNFPIQPIDYSILKK